MDITTLTQCDNCGACGHNLNPIGSTCSDARHNGQLTRHLESDIQYHTGSHESGYRCTRCGHERKEVCQHAEFCG